MWLMQVSDRCTQEYRPFAPSAEQPCKNLAGCQIALRRLTKGASTCMLPPLCPSNKLDE